MTRKIIIYLCLFISLGCEAQKQENDPPGIVTGAEQVEAYLDELKGKKVGLVVNQSSLIGDTHLLDTLLSLGIDADTVFTPEHGFKGTMDAGEKIDNEKDEKRNIAIISLYGKNKKPAKEIIDALDIIVYDLQDVGARFYTYASTMHLMMEACSESGKPVIFLDRPNPNGDVIDGPILDTAFRSFVGMHPVPIAHGLTLGELARMINGEGWLTGGMQCETKVIEMKNYTHGTPYHLPVKPSPNLPTHNSIRWYPSLCLFEGTRISIGRGTYFPFEVAGYPNPDFGDFEFTPVSIDGMSKHPKHQDKTCYGVDLRETMPEKRINLRYLIDFYQKFEDKEDFFIPYFNTLAGTDQLQEQIRSGMSEEEIRKSWEPGLEEYRKMRERYVLYE